MVCTPAQQNERMKALVGMFGTQPLDVHCWGGHGSSGDISRGVTGETREASDRCSGQETTLARTLAQLSLRGLGCAHAPFLNSRSDRLL